MYAGDEVHRMNETRRGLLKLVTLATATAGLAPAADRPKLLTEKDRIEIPGKPEEIVAKARQLGSDYYAKYGNCAQSTLAALQDALDFLPANDRLFLAATALAGGATANGNANCGGFTGAAIIFGDLCGRPRDQFADRGAAKVSTALIRQIATKYEDTYGNVLCKDVKAKVSGNCKEVVANAAGWAAEAILKQFQKA
jgi:hypothetical protein